MADSMYLLQTMHRIVSLMSKDSPAASDSVNGINQDLASFFNKNTNFSYVHQIINKKHVFVVNNLVNSSIFQLFTDNTGKGSYDIFSNNTTQIDEKSLTDSLESRTKMYKDAIRFEVFPPDFKRYNTVIGKEY